jgi:glyoxylase-like metal-dependent hydrolase (beta-lactamase superfamily II)
LVADAEIIGTVGCVEDLREAPASRNRLLMRAGRVVQTLGAGGRLAGRVLGAVGIDKLTTLADAAEIALPLFEDFDFSSKPVLPNRTFEGELTLKVGDKEVVLIEVGPAHTLGDAVVWVPADKTLFTGDILFKDAHPVVWQGPVSNWIGVLDRLLDMDIETVVPGHGPLADRSGLRETRHYFQVLTKKARECYDAGLPVEEAVIDLELSEFDRWLDAERVYVNVRTLYRDFSGDTEAPDPLSLFAGMSRVRARMKGRR